MSIQLVLLSCQQIKLAGKKPTTALVKAKLGPGVPLALIIKGIQVFNANPDIEVEMPPMEAPKTENISSCQCEKEIRQLSDHMLVLEKQIKSLQEQVLALAKP